MLTCAPRSLNIFDALVQTGRAAVNADVLGAAWGTVAIGTYLETW